MNGLSFRQPDRWPSYSELTDHAARMRSVHELAGTLSPTMLGVPTILDQGSEGSCGGEAIVQDIHIARQALDIESEILSPAFPYWCCRREAVDRDEDVADVGIDPFDMIRAVDDFGACKFLNMAYDTSRPNEKPGALAFQTAQKVRAKMAPIFSAGPELFPALQHVVSVERKPLFLAIEVCPSFDNVGPDGFVGQPGGPIRGRHAIAGYGWDARGVHFANSWGVYYGNRGCGILSPEYLAEHCIFAASVELV